MEREIVWMGEKKSRGRLFLIFFYFFFLFILLLVFCFLLTRVKQRWGGGNGAMGGRNEKVGVLQLLSLKYLRIHEGCTCTIKYILPPPPPFSCVVGWGRLVCGLWFNKGL